MPETEVAGQRMLMVSKGKNKIGSVMISETPDGGSELTITGIDAEMRGN